MNARDSATGDGPADTGNPAADQPDPYQRQIEALERTIEAHQRRHAERLATLERESQGYLATLQEERKLLIEAQEGQRRREAVDGPNPEDAQVRA